MISTLDVEQVDRSRQRLLLTPREAAQALAVSERTLWAHTYPRGSVPRVHLGWCVRYDAADLRAWIESQKNKPSEKPRTRPRARRLQEAANE